ncbi:hypothetical protein DPEC_G00042840 [Dallia pectoralis]|uniref:Uncharacterized protein n=1 Tax=Dallia pectoralis TaxID=75939 RepID=A0ACC2H9Q5_DALPE|nr:hypothetical protein DPEC_G00042840 [Dallia pectoralis]
MKLLPACIWFLCATTKEIVREISTIKIANQQAYQEYSWRGDLGFDFSLSNDESATHPAGEEHQPAPPISLESLPECAPPPEAFQPPPLTPPAALQSPLRQVPTKQPL